MIIEMTIGQEIMEIRMNWLWHIKMLNGEYIKKILTNGFLLGILERFKDYDDI